MRSCLFESIARKRQKLSIGYDAGMSLVDNEGNVYFYLDDDSSFVLPSSYLSLLVLLRQNDLHGSC